MQTSTIAALIGGLALVVTQAVWGGCGGDCDIQYESDIEDCHSQFGSDPEDADDLARCIQDARDDYETCVEDCGAQAD